MQVNTHAIKQQIQNIQPTQQTQIKPKQKQNTQTKQSQQ